MLLLDRHFHTVTERHDCRFHVRFIGGMLDGQTKTYIGRVPAREKAHFLPDGAPVPREVWKEYMQHPERYPWVKSHIYELQPGLPPTFALLEER